MIDAHTLERLQAGAIIRPGANVKIHIGMCTVHVRPLNEFRLAQSRATFANMDINPEKMGDSVQAAMADFLSDCVQSVAGMEDIDGDPVDVDINKEPGTALSIAFCSEIIRDVTTLSNLTGGLSGKSDSLLQPLSANGLALNEAAAAASATPASNGNATGQKRKTRTRGSRAAQ